MSVEVDPITSADGRPATVTPFHGETIVKTHDEQILELLTNMNNTLSRILAILEIEFEMDATSLADEEQV